MASTVVPEPVLDLRNGDAVAAQAIAALPSELSDRSDSNPAVVWTEAVATIFDKYIYQLNRWPSAVIQKVLSLCGVTLVPASAATVSQTFTLSAPQSSDTLIPAETSVSNADASVTFETSSDLTIPAYTTPAGTVTISAGSSTVTGSGTTFQTGTTWQGWQIQIPATTGVWYTILSVASTTSLTITTTATNAVATGVAFNVGPITGSVTAQATTTGSATNVGAAKLTSLSSAPNGVSSTSNNAAATGGADIETTTAAIARAPIEFASRDVACAIEDYEAFAVDTLGAGGRCKAKANTSTATAATGYVTVALLSPNWTTSSSVTTIERAAVIRDLAARVFSGATTIDVPATITSYTPTVMFYRKSAYDENTVRCNIAAAINSYLNPNTYQFGRSIYLPDLVSICEGAAGVDRVEEINGIPCVFAGAQVTTGGTLAFTNGSATVTASSGTDVTNMVTTPGANRTIIIDSTNKKAYITRTGSGTTMTVDDSSGGASFTGASVTAAFSYIIPADTAYSVTTQWYVLPYSNLSTTVSSPPATIICVGSV